MTRKYTDAEKEKVLDEILEHFAAEDRRHLRKLRQIRIQGYFMRGLIIAVVLFFVLAPFLVPAAVDLFKFLSP